DAEPIHAYALEVTVVEGIPQLDEVSPDVRSVAHPPRVGRGVVACVYAVAYLLHHRLLVGFRPAIIQDRFEAIDITCAVFAGVVMQLPGIHPGYELEVDHQ